MVKCDICGKTGIKSKAGLAGHKQIAHSADTRITVPDDMGKRLEAVEKNQRRIVDLTKTVVDTIKKSYGYNNRALCRLYQTVFTKDSKIAISLRKKAKCEDIDNPECLRKKNNGR